MPPEIQNHEKYSFTIWLTYFIWNRLFTKRKLQKSTFLLAILILMSLLFCLWLSFWHFVISGDRWQLFSTVELFLCKSIIATHQLLIPVCLYPSLCILLIFRCHLPSGIWLCIIWGFYWYFWNEVRVSYQ